MMCSRILDKQYFSSQTINGRLSTLALHTCSMLHSPRDRWDLQRYLLAAQKVFYWNLRRIDAESHQYKPTDKQHPGSWDALCSSWLLPNNLLTQRECDFLAGYKGNRCTALFALYEQRLRIVLPSASSDPPAGAAGAPALAAGAADADRQTISGRADFKRAMVEHVLAIKTQMASTMEVQHLKVPFSYYHLTYLLLLTCLVLLAYAFVFTNAGRGNPATLIIYPAIVVVLSGLQEQANKMSDPFGHDETDLNADALVLLALDESRALCFAPHPEDDHPEDDPSFHDFLGDDTSRADKKDGVEKDGDRNGGDRNGGDRNGGDSARARPGAAAAAAWAAQHPAAASPPPPPPAPPAGRASSAWAEPAPPPPAAACDSDDDSEEEYGRPPPAAPASPRPLAPPPAHPDGPPAAGREARTPSRIGAAGPAAAEGRGGSPGPGPGRPAEPVPPQLQRLLSEGAVAPSRPP